MSYVELHAHSAYSFLDGASHPEELALRAAELGYEALALTDHDGVYGSLEFAHAAKLVGVRAITGAEVTLRGGSHVTLLVESSQGYANLCRLLTAAHAGTRPKEGADPLPPALDPALLAELNEGLVCLSGCARQGSACATRTPPRGSPAPSGRDRFYVELQRPFERGDARRNALLRDLAEHAGVETIATGNVHAHHPRRTALQDVLVAIRSRTSLDGCEQERRGNRESILRAPAEMLERFPDDRDAVLRTAEVAERLEFDLTAELGYRYPDFSDGAEPAIRQLAEVCEDAFSERYPPSNRVLLGQARARLEQELRLIDELGLAGFFLLHWEVLELAREIALRGARPRLAAPLPAAGPGARQLGRLDRLLPDRALARRSGRERPLARPLPQPRARLGARHRPRLPARHPREADRRRHRALRPRARGARRELRHLPLARRDPRRRQGARAFRSPSWSGSRGSPTAGTRSGSPRSSRSCPKPSGGCSPRAGAPSRS